MVRVWRAPYNGIVNITGTVNLILPSGDYDANEYEHADGVRVAIQSGGTERWNKTISKGDATAYPANVNNLTVQKTIGSISVYSPVQMK